MEQHDRVYYGACRCVLSKPAWSPAGGGHSPASHVGVCILAPMAGGAHLGPAAVLQLGGRWALLCAVWELEVWRSDRFLDRGDGAVAVWKGDVPFAEGLVDCDRPGPPACFAVVFSVSSGQVWCTRREGPILRIPGPLSWLVGRGFLLFYFKH